MVIPHFDRVNTQQINSRFSNDRRHRYFLEIPFLDRTGGNTLCVIGQNPSEANNIVADKTVAYIEKYVYTKLTRYSKILVINLYSRIDKKKENTYDLIREEGIIIYNEIINANSDFLIIYGQSAIEGAYRFMEKKVELRDRLNNKDVYKINIDSIYAPHPGNPEIRYNNFECNTVRYSFEDVI